MVDKNNLRDFEEAKIKNGVYIPNGVDIGRLRFDKEKSERQKNQDFRFLFVGRLEEQKGVKYLIHAARILIEQTKFFGFY